MNFSHFYGAGLGIRSAFYKEILEQPKSCLDFIEITPENWMGTEGKRGETLLQCTQTFPTLAHGLNLSIGGISPLNTRFLDQLATFFERFHVLAYSEHLSFSTDDQGYLYDLLPIPYTLEALDYIAERIQSVQNHLGMKVAFENSSYYTVPQQEMSEQDFIEQLLEKADCLLLLDVNNVYVNAVNHGYDPYDFIASLPSQRIAYLHIAGHKQQSETLIIDTHGATVINPVWELLLHTYQCHGLKPTVLERDSNIPPLATLLQEVETIRQLQQEGSL
jgi:uncharacterized protein